jgi:predicted DNA-binding transcriptional regulator YafY
MRADRLVAAVLLLQARGRITARELATELETSVATARRDLEALSTAGIPVYPQAGRGGGWQLLGGSRTDLSGLTAPEAQALFLLLGPAAALDPTARAALRKLVRALPSTFRADAEAAAAAVVVDRTAWGSGGPASEAEASTDGPGGRGGAEGADSVRGRRLLHDAHLALLQEAVVLRRAVRLRYTGWSSPEAELLVEPWGLVQKNDIWYLLGPVAAADGASPSAPRTFRVERMRTAELTEHPVERPAGLDLGAEWERVVAEVEQERAAVSAELLVESALVGYLRSRFGRHCEMLESRDDGRSRVRVAAGTGTMIARELAGWGGFAEVLEPAAVRAELATLGAQLIALYGPPP